MRWAPRLLDRLTPEDREHFETVTGLLDRVGLAYELDATLVRGLDYYTRTVFEFTSDALGAQSALGGGGRYDGLVAELGGPETPAIGWAAGVERILLAIGDEEAAATLDGFVAATDGERERALSAVHELRAAGVRADLDLAGRSMKGQMKQAGRSGAAVTLILDAESAKVRDMGSGEERVDELQALLDELRREA